MTRWDISLFLLLMMSGCGSPLEEVSNAAPRHPYEVKGPSGPPATTNAKPPPFVPSAAKAADTPAVPKAPPPLDPGPVFPPPSFKPPFARTAKPKDGVYESIDLGAAYGTFVIARTLVHPHAVASHPYVVIVAIDLRRASLQMVAGTEEPTSTAVPAEHRKGLVPASDLPNLLAVFNGGFMAKHGKWGMMVDREVFLPPRPEACTIALLDDGSVHIASFPALAPLEGRLRSYRQTPPCLIEGGALHPRLPNEDTARLWGAAVNGARDIRRTALGLDSTGQTLYFALGEWVWAKDLALALHSAGASVAAELDINWSYTRFLLYDKKTPPEVVSTLVEKVEYTKNGYIERPAPRDFFYVTLKRP